MDNDLKWVAIMAIGIFMAIALMFAFDENAGKSQETQQYEACIANTNNSHKDCKGVLE